MTRTTAGGADTTSSAVDINLSADGGRLQVISMTAPDKKVFMPPVMGLEGGSPVSIVKNAGQYRFAVVNIVDISGSTPFLVTAKRIDLDLAVPNTHIIAATKLDSNRIYVSFSGGIDAFTLTITAEDRVLVSDISERLEPGITSDYISSLPHLMDRTLCRCAVMLRISLAQKPLKSINQKGED